MTIYYVDATGGDDEDVGTAEESAWQTLGKINTEFASSTFSRGDSILFKRGESWTTTGWGDNLWIRNIGAGAGYLTISAYGTGDLPNFDGGADQRPVVYTDDGAVESYFIVENLDVENTRNPAVWFKAATNFIVQNCHIHNTDPTAGSAPGIYLNWDASDFIIRYNTIHDLGGEAIYCGRHDNPDDHTGNGIIHDNELYDGVRELVDFKIGCQNIRLVKNTIYNGCQVEENCYVKVGGTGHRICGNTITDINSKWGIHVGYDTAVAESSDIIVEDNLINGAPDVGSVGVRLGISSRDNTADDIIVRRNDIYNCTYGVAIYRATNVRLVSNVFRSNVGTGVYIYYTDTVRPSFSDGNWFSGGLSNDYYDGVAGAYRTRSYMCTNHSLDCNGHDGEPTTTAVYDDDANLAGWWELDEASGNRSDSGPNSLTLTDNNTVGSDLEDYKQGSGCADFERDNTEYLSITDNATLSITGAISFGGWVKVESLPATMVAMGKWTTSGDQRSYQIVVTDSGRVRIQLSSDGTGYSADAYTDDAVGALDVWYHIVGVYNGSNVRLYINGDVEWNGSYNPDTYSSGIYDSTSSFEIGAREGGGLAIDAKIDEAFVFNRAITASEVRYIYNNGIQAAASPVESGSVTVGIVRQAAATDTGTQDFTDANIGGETVKAALFIITAATSDATAADHAIVGVGATDGTNQWTCSVASEHGQADTDDDRRGMTDKCICIINHSDASVDGEAEIDSIITNGVRINWTNAPAAAYLVTCILFAGSDVSAHANVFTGHATVDNTTDVTDPGFEPDCLIVASHDDAFDDGVATSLMLSLGVVVNGVAVEQYSVTIRESAHSAGWPSGYFSNAYGIMQVNDDGTIAWAGEFSDFDANGFSCTSRTDGAGGDQVGYLALYFNSVASVDAGTDTTPTSTGSDSVVTPGFEPQFVLIGMSNMQALNTAYEQSDQAGSVGIAAIGANSQYHNSIQVESASATTDTQSYSSDIAIDQPQDDGSAGLAASFTSFDATGWTLNWTAVLGSAVYYWWLAIQNVGTSVPIFAHYYRRRRV